MTCRRSRSTCKGWRGENNKYGGRETKPLRSKAQHERTNEINCATQILYKLIIRGEGEGRRGKGSGERRGPEGRNGEAYLY